MVVIPRPVAREIDHRFGIGVVEFSLVHSGQDGTELRRYKPRSIGGASVQEGPVLIKGRPVFWPIHVSSKTTGHAMVTYLYDSAAAH